MTSAAGVSRRSWPGLSNVPNLILAAGIVAFALVTFYWFPGHTYLQSDTQIYIPLMERLWDPSLFTRDLLASRPHLAYTLYDEIAFIIRRIAHVPFQFALEVQQVVFRAAGLWGVFLVGSALGLERRFAFAVMALFGLGATIIGPAVLTFEYEPVPRGFAVMLLFCAIGLAMNNLLEFAGTVAAIAFVYHAPTTVPFWIVFAFVCYKAGRTAWRAWMPLALATVLILLMSRLQPGVSEAQVFFARLDPEVVSLQKIRAPYNWISLWPATAFWQYAVLSAAALVAVMRLRAPGAPRTLLLGLTGIGLASIPFTFVAQDVYHWALMPQFQPARAVLLITACAVIACGAAAMRAGIRRNGIEAGLWLLVPVVVPLHKSVLPLVTFNLTDPLSGREAIVLLGTVAVIAGVLVWTSTRPRFSPALVAAVLLAYVAIPLGGGVENYPRVWSSDLIELNQWARSATPQTALFHFPGAGHALYPGVFRAEALRSVYVDWKTGGQVNYFKSLGEEWWSRWQATMLHDPGIQDLKSRGIDYAVVKNSSKWRGGLLVYSNGTYSVYKL
jgi:hypothetical protein